jgi:putative PIN family toxin of toxin-antitoxin system
MRVVLDSNVITSALLSTGGAPARVLEHWEAGTFDLVSSPALMEELERALNYPKILKYLQKAEVDPAAFAARFRKLALILDPDEDLNIIQEDPADNQVLAAAAVGGASLIISGDQHLLTVKDFRGIQILPPAGFLILLENME